VSGSKTVVSQHLNEAVEAKERKKVILIPFKFPTELIRAFESTVPLKLFPQLALLHLRAKENLIGTTQWPSTYESLCSADAFTLVQSCRSVEVLELLPDAVVEDALGFCDANSKMHDFVAEYLQVPRFFTNKFGSSEKEYEL